MTFIFDVAAGVLLATAIVGFVILCVQAARADERWEERLTVAGLIWWSLAMLGVVVWIAFVVCRLLRWP